jgi:hypothetical protein
MLGVWGDVYTKHPDLIIPQVHMYPNTALHPQICTVVMCQFISKENIKILGIQTSFISEKTPAFKVI